MADKQAEEQQRGSQVSFEDKDADAGDPGDDDGAEVSQAREADAEDLRPGQNQLVTVGHEVASEEDGQQDLRDLTGLEGHRADADPDACAVDRLAQAGNQREQEEDQRSEPREEGVAAQPPVVTLRR